MSTRRLLHELSNQLTVIRGSAELVRNRLLADGVSNRDVQYIIGAAERSIRLVRELKALDGGQRWPKWWARGKA